MTRRKATEYLDPEGVSPYGKWFAQLNAEAAYKVTTAVYRLELGNFSNVKPVRDGVSEYKLISAWICIYFGIDGNVLIILLRRQ
jgi:putative addiction module killer protein